jgi:hypothetical protein
MSRIDAARRLHLLIAELGDGLLDQAAIDRCKSALFGTIKRECTAVLSERQRDAHQMKLGAA